MLETSSSNAFSLSDSTSLSSPPLLTLGPFIQIKTYCWSSLWVKNKNKAALVCRSTKAKYLWVPWSPVFKLTVFIYSSTHIRRGSFAWPFPGDLNGITADCLVIRVVKRCQHTSAQACSHSEPIWVPCWGPFPFPHHFLFLLCLGTHTFSSLDHIFILFIPIY